MILVMSQESYEFSTDEVQDWIEALGGDCVRLNGEDVTGSEPYALRLDDAGEALEFRLDGRPVRHAEVGAVWLRRWHQLRALGPVTQDAGLRRDVQSHLAREVMATSASIFGMLGGARWLSHPETRRVNKLRALRAARDAGLAIPATLLTNDKRTLQAFMAAHPDVITKCVGDADMLNVEGRTFGMYTARLSAEDVDALPDTFFPSLVQEMVEKSCELRVFYLDGECWPMAIFSQNDAQTAVDFRRYNVERPNRTVPYRLPAEVEAAVRRFMETMRLDTGSLDLIRTPDGRHVFLEVNPAGQFAMVSEPCNYPLHRRVAEYLIRRDERDHQD
ncbi:grasp-with-spasm system ATP-grasp peptide maturase [Longimicrobium sp.]|uniref:grasp-with-spasm system ATP-grasp peptide maturase n=1 Tax=Longimicrobium sp. TaxID=2029185 RepID=UPI002C8B02C2|nr:grasp-with-spasm system ATP-grasp peptide maturase [Longimicrobium sp.]HSU12854.1 grasp-with-spasm system ATP-grasp peptide maturase [Longimicrobium sp.]